jgi:hypothetical protein
MSASQNPGPYTLGPYIIQSILLLVAPALFAASIYMELGRIVLMVDGQRSLFVRRTWLTKIFVTGDVFSFLLQSSGELSILSIRGDVDANIDTQAADCSQAVALQASIWATISSSPVSSFK